MQLRHALVPLTVAVALSGCDGGDDGGPADTGMADTGVRDTGSSDTGAADTGAPDTGAPDTGASDTGAPDTGALDAGEDLRIPSLDGPVQVDFDDLGVLHLSCSTDQDCFAAQGYFHAAHRFGQMDLRRRVVRGKLAEVLPLQPGIDSDRNFRTLIGTRTGARVEDQILAASSTTTRAMLDAYSRGVNAWIEDFRNGENGARLTDDWAHLRDQIEDWAPVDSIACVLALIESLTNTTGYELELADALAAVNATVAADLFSLRPATSSSILSNNDFSSIDPNRINDLMAVQARLGLARGAIRDARSRLPERPEGLGSNNWVLGPIQSADGRAHLSNDPHLGLSFASIWYLAHLDAKTNGTGRVHVAGVSFAGLPGVILGHNEEIAWGATTTFFDMSDVYLEALNANGTAVMFNGQDVPIVEQTFRINVSGGQPINHTVRYVPHHGPILSEDAVAGVALSLKWTGQDASTDANFLYALNVASSADTARTALENVTTIGQNWVVIDRAGDFGWFPYNRVPNRPWASPLVPSWVPVPGDGSAEWQGFVPYADLPQAFSPPEGFIATANNDMTGHLADGNPTNDGQAAYQAFVADGYRHQRIVERITGQMNQHTLQTMQSIQADVRSNLAAHVLPNIVAAAQGQTLTADGLLVLSALETWDYQCPTGLSDIDPMSAKDPDAGRAASSIGCTAFHVLWPRLIAMTFNDELAGAGVSPRVSAMVFQIAAPSALIGDYWDDVSTAGGVETMGDVVAAALDDAGSFLSINVGSAADDWRWGRIHTITLSADIFPPDSDTYANDGGLYTVDVANPSDMTNGVFSHGSGPSMRLSCEADVPSGVSCTIELPGGQRHFANSPHFTDLFLKWLVNDPSPIHFTATDVAAASVETLMVRPEFR